MDKIYKDIHGNKLFWGDVVMVIDKQDWKAVIKVSEPDTERMLDGWDLYNPNCCQSCRDWFGAIGELEEFVWRCVRLGNIVDEPDLFPLMPLKWKN